MLNFGGYSATKAAVEHLADEYRQEIAQYDLLSLSLSHTYTHHLRLWLTLLI